MKTKQIVFTKINTAELLEAEYELPKEREVTVCLEYSALSAGTERANITGLRCSPFASEDYEPKFPLHTGYSAAGIVTQVGSNVDDIKIGDKVVVYQGYHKKMITVHRNKVVKIPEGVSVKEASMAYIATFSLAAIRKTRVEMGETGMVMGLGILGIMAIKELRAAGAMPIIAVDPIKERRDFALQMGADFAFDPTELDFAEKVKEISQGGADVVIEVTGLGTGLVQALDCTKKFGRVALLGCTRSSDFKLDYYSKVHAPGISLIGAHTMARPSVSYPGYWSQVDDIKAVLELLRGGRLRFEDMIGAIYSPMEATEVYSCLVFDKAFPPCVLFDWNTIEGSF